MEIKFTIPGKPREKQRPRVCRINGKTITYTPKQTTEYEKWVRASYIGVSKMFFDKNIPPEISIIALFSISSGKLPKPSRAQNLLEEKSITSRAEGLISGNSLQDSKEVASANCPTARWPTKKPDSDNIIKIILDALNGVCYHDDSQICKIYFEKKYSEIPKVEITIKEIVL